MVLRKKKRFNGHERNLLTKYEDRMRKQKYHQKKKTDETYSN